GSIPPPMTIRLVSETANDIVVPSLPSGPAEVGFETVAGMSDSAGRFTLLGVPAGEYVLRHANAFLSATAQQGMPAYWGAQRIPVGGNDLNDLAVNLKPALRVEGRSVYTASGGTQQAPANSLLVFE